MTYIDTRHGVLYACHHHEPVLAKDVGLAMRGDLLQELVIDTPRTVANARHASKHVAQRRLLGQCADGLKVEEVYRRRYTTSDDVRRAFFITSKRFTTANDCTSHFAMKHRRPSRHNLSHQFCMFSVYEIEANLAL